MTSIVESWDLEGWKDVGAFFGVSEVTARKWARERRMPVDRLCGRVRASSAKLRAWALRSGVLSLASDRDR